MDLTKLKRATASCDDMIGRGHPEEALAQAELARKTLREAMEENDGYKHSRNALDSIRLQLSQTMPFMTVKPRTANPITAALYSAFELAASGYHSLRKNFLEGNTGQLEENCDDLLRTVNQLGRQVNEKIIMRIRESSAEKK